jgi:hypothetical protein
MLRDARPALLSMTVGTRAQFECSCSVIAWKPSSRQMSAPSPLDFSRATNMDARNRPAYDSGTGTHADYRVFLRHRYPNVFHRSPAAALFAAYSGHEANVSIETRDVIEGHLPPNAARLVKQWALAHSSELEDNWLRARAGMPLAKIVGLDDD